MLLKRLHDFPGIGVVASFFLSLLRLGSGRARYQELSLTRLARRLAGLACKVQNANGTVLTKTQSDTNGSFIISGLPAGDYRLVVSHAGFETKEIPVTIGPTEQPPRAAHLSGRELCEHHHQCAGPGG